MEPKRPIFSISDTRSQRGVISVLFTLLLPLLLAFGAFAVDYPYLTLTRAQMQTVADAAALAGARYLGEGGSANWDTAIAQTQSALALNSVGGKAISQATILAGYWDTSSNRAGLQPLPMNPTKTDVPAIKVSTSQSAGQNFGEVSTIFANFFGIKSMPISVSAVAARSGPSTVGANTIFPLAFSQCIFDKYWDSSSNPPGPKLDSKGNPIQFNIGSKSDPGCIGTSYSSGDWAVPAGENTDYGNLAGFVMNRIPQSLSLGDPINVTPGSHSNTLYSTVDGCSAAAIPSKQTCRFVTIPVLSNGVKAGNNTIYGFACIEILGSGGGGSSKYVVATMSQKCKVTPSTGIGPSYGFSSPPKLFM